MLLLLFFSCKAQFDQNLFNHKFNYIFTIFNYHNINDNKINDQARIKA